MKGVVLAGGLGTRLNPLTKVTNKHLLPVYDRPMIYYPIQTLVNAGIEEIMLVTGGNNAGDFLKLLGNGQEFGLKHLNYTYQQGEGGIADALRLAEHFADGEQICVVLGDNIIEGNIAEAATSNIFLVKANSLLTPSLDSGILPGVTRTIIIKIAKKLGMAVREKSVSGRELLGSDEVFLTNSLAEILPVTRIDGRRIGLGLPGEVTKLLHISYQKQVIREVLR